MKENLEIGKDYVSEVNGVIVIDRIGVSGNRGFFEGFFVCNLVCSSPDEWREATESEVVEAFKKDLIHRYGKDWETMKIKERHPDSTIIINDGSWNVVISKFCDGWVVWNKNGILYFNGIWVEKLEEEGEEENVEKLEVGKDYINVHDNNVIIIDKTENIINRGFEGGEYKIYMSCLYTSNWREATEAEVVEAFKKHLTHRYGEDWKTMKIKERHPELSSTSRINDGLWDVKISKEYDGWNVLNKNGLLYCDGIWVERLEEEPKIHIKEAIKENTVIHCETEQEANRILGMAHELGYRWWNGKKYEADDTEWNVYKSTMCYYLFDGSYSDYSYFKNRNYTIIPSIQIADLEPTKSSDWVLAPEEIEEIKAGEKVDNRYALKRDVLTILSVESKLNPDKKISEYLEQFKLILEIL